MHIFQNGISLIYFMDSVNNIEKIFYYVPLVVHIAQSNTSLKNIFKKFILLSQKRSTYSLQKNQKIQTSKKKTIKKCPQCHFTWWKTVLMLWSISFLTLLCHVYGQMWFYIKIDFMYFCNLLFKNLTIELALCIWGLYSHRFKQPKIKNIWKKNSRKLQKAKLEFAARCQCQLFT